MCKYRLQHDANRVTMIANCKDCQRGEKPSLNNQSCLSGILNGLLQEYNVDSVILSHYIETKYTNEPIVMLKAMVDIVHDMEQMGIRDPFKEYFEGSTEPASSQKNQKIICERCELSPHRIFTALKKDFIGDISKFYAAFNEISNSVDSNEKMECTKCIEVTKSDMIYLFKKLENFRASVIYKGFQIVI